MISLNSIVELENCQPNIQAEITLYLADIREMETTAKQLYIRLYFRDGKNMTSVPLWSETLQTIGEKYKRDTVYALVVTTDTYKDKTVIKRIVSACEIADETIIKRFKPHLYKSATPVSCQLVMAAVQSLKETDYWQYVRAIYGESEATPQFERLKGAFASINWHDNYPGGLLNHVGGMLSLAASIKSKYLAGRCEDKWDVDWRYIIAGILLHDIGKLNTYELVGEKVVRFKEDCQLDHNDIGVGILYAIHYGLPEEDRPPEAVLQKLAYTARYHDDIEKLYSHKRIEDKIISYLDGLDATLAVGCLLSVE